ncbi:hypothetical protein ACFQZO_10305 [Bradyrhizobium sp. GCM10027634]|uniref:hypothetical protein n=1 Tax=unclassified Bradyrhizobium TaxID=2631580 RepID=UPI00263B321F|nr:hypothetical protein [Bradyrhizobium sp. WYCCWR 12677]MDN5001275.1 hypothetical protein [Bradyrhizobium sp. WYCCWR 12677]
MFVTVVAVLCRLSSTECINEIVTSSTLDNAVTFQSCMINGQAALAKWKDEHPIYHSEAWRIERYKCVPGEYKLAHHKV